MIKPKLKCEKSVGLIILKLNSHKEFQTKLVTGT